MSNITLDELIYKKEQLEKDVFILSVIFIVEYFK
jgi:hypothetical protein